MKKDRGFTLIELMVVAGIIAILAAIAIPSYLNQTRKARRNAAGAAMQQIALGQERFRADCTTYATGFSFDCPAGAPPTFPPLNSFYSQTFYTITITAGSTDGTRYEIVATPAGTQANDTCGTLTWDFGVTTAGIVTKTPTNCWSN